MADAAYLHALILGAVEGITEFLPISSTGHLILAGDLLGFNDERGKVFDIAIQTGAMLAVIWEYRARFAAALGGAFSDRAQQRFIANLAVAFMPAALIGLAFASAIKAQLFKPIPVATAFIVGGFVILWVERRGHRPPRVVSVDDMTWRDALKVGIAQAFALIPGTSRSGATIIGGMLFGLSRQAATEFSFFLAGPTLVAAGTGLFAVGFVTAFVAAFAVVRWLIRYVASHDFRPFAWYRVAFGAAVLITAYGGLVDWTGH